jgi:hypothetical protein
MEIKKLKTSLVGLKSGFVLVRQVLCYLSHTPNPFAFSLFFQIKSHAFGWVCLGLPSSYLCPPTLPLL